jgi:translation initiation factor eIF-2B subunit delta
LKSKELQHTPKTYNHPLYTSYLNMAASTPTDMSASTSTSAHASPTTAQTTPSSNNGEPSQNSSQPKPSKSQSKPAGKGKPEVAEGGGKAKSAKELAKEEKKGKRAAKVAARGGGEEGDASTSTSGAGTGSGSGNQGSAGRPDKVSIDGTPHPTSATRPTFTSHDSTLPQQQPPPPSKQEGFYSHVVTHKQPDTREAFNSGRIHPLVVRLGVLMANGELRGANARTMGMMCAFKEVIRDYETPENVVMWKDLMSHLSPMISFLEGCRPKGTGGGNAIRYVS